MLSNEKLVPHRDNYGSEQKRASMRNRVILPEMGNAARKMLDVHFSRRQAFDKWQGVLDKVSTEQAVTC
jgi:hypothetical protein